MPIYVGIDWVFDKKKVLDCILGKVGSSVSGASLMLDLVFL